MVKKKREMVILDEKQKIYIQTSTTTTFKHKCTRHTHTFKTKRDG